MEGGFGGRHDHLSQTYLRQALHRLREVLPAEATLTLDADELVGVAITSDSARFGGLLAEAACLFRRRPPRRPGARLPCTRRGSSAPLIRTVSVAGDLRCASPPLTAMAITSPRCSAAAHSRSASSASRRRAKRANCSARCADDRIMKRVARRRRSSEE